MKVNALLMDENDNVATCIRKIETGEAVHYRLGEELFTILAMEEIPYCHKISLADIKKGGAVMKYGEIIGEAQQDIPAGHWVSHRNINSVPRDYESELL